MRASSVWIAALLALSQSGCGVLFQTALGWSDERTVRRVEPRRIEIDAIPGGAAVERESNGATTQLGSTPLADRIEVTVEDKISETRVYGVGLGALAELVGMIGFAVGFAASCDGGSDCSAGLPITAGIFGMASMIDFTVALLCSYVPDEIESSEVVEPPKVTYRVSRLGYEQGVRHLSVKQSEEIKFKLPMVAAPQPVATIRVAKEGAVIAVMPVSAPPSASEDREGELMTSLENQLRVDLARQGLRTVDRGAQEALLRAQITDLKSDSYSSCYDEACQIELGKALAATHLLRSRVARFGSQCVLNGELIDLSLEVSIAAGSARGGCAPESFLEMSTQLTRDLLASR